MSRFGTTLALGLVLVSRLAAEDPMDAVVATIVDQAEVAAQARWTAGLAGLDRSQPPLRWAAWGRGERTGDDPALASGGLELATPWATLGLSARQNPAPLDPGAMANLAISLADGEPGGRWTGWAAERNRAADQARLDAVVDLRRTADRLVSDLALKAESWAGAQTLAQAAAEADRALAAAEVVADRTSPRRARALAEDAARARRQADLAALLAPGERWYETVILGTEPSGPGPDRPITPLLQTGPAVLEAQLRVDDVGRDQARRALDPWPTATVNLSAQQEVWGQTPPVVGLELRLGGWIGAGGPAPVRGDPLALVAAAHRQAQADEARRQARLVPEAEAAALALDQARRAWTDLEADQAVLAPVDPLAGAKDRVAAQVEVGRRWVELVRARVDRALAGL